MIMMFLSLSTLLTLTSFTSALGIRGVGGLCDCSGTRPGGVKNAAYICRDERLGPTILPILLPLAPVVSTYDRFDGLSPGEFLAKWTDDAGNYVYPPQNGFQLDVDGNAINGTMELQPGTLVDRFGSERGTYISAAAAPFSQRALPPSSLATSADAPDFPYNYHLYRVIKPLRVVGGPIAPWFGQPGLGAQFFTGETGNIMKLVDDGFLKREDPYVLIEEKNHGCASYR